MTAFTAAFLCSVLAFISLIQPCPAPPVVAGIVGGVALGAGAAIGGAAVSGRGGRKRDTTSANATSTTMLRGSKMSACMAENLGAVAPTIQKISDTSMVIGGIVPACMTAIRAYNDDLDIVNLNAAHGTTTVLNDTAIWVYGVPPRMMSTLGHFLDNNFPDVPAHQPSSG